MATNPRFPEPRDRDRDRDSAQLNADLRRNAPKSGFPWVVIALLAAAAILAAILIWMPRTPKAQLAPSAAEAPPQPTGGQIAFSGAKLVPAAVGNQVELNLLMTNNGQTDVTGVAVTGQFKDANGKTIAAIPGQVELLDSNNGATKGLVQEPVPANTQKPVRIVFDQVPDGWNHQVPAITVTTVTAAGNASGGVGGQPTTGREAAETTGEQNGKTAQGQAHQNQPKQKP